MIVNEALVCFNIRIELSLQIKQCISVMTDVVMTESDDEHKKFAPRRTTREELAAWGRGRSSR